jgi:hypothetical protein
MPHCNLYMLMSHLPSSETLNALNAKGIDASDTNFTASFTAAARKAYASAYAHLLEVAEAQHEGVLSVTLHTRTGEIVVPIDQQVSSSLTVELQEMISRKLQGLQSQILTQLAEAHHETGDADGSSDRAQVFALCMPQSSATMKTLPAQAFTQQSEVA